MKPLRMLAHVVRGQRGRPPPIGSLRLVTPAWLTVASALALSLLGLYAIDLADRAPAGAGMSVGASVGVGAAGQGSAGWLAVVGATTLKQIVFLNLGLIAAVLLALPHYRWFARLAWPAYAVALGLLVFLIVPGVPSAIVRPRNGARAWIDLGPVDFQPSEVAKIACALALAAFLARRPGGGWVTTVLWPTVIAGAMVGLILRQPDLGSASLFVPVTLGVALVAGARKRVLAGLIGVALIAAPASWPLLAEHQKERIIGVLELHRGDATLEQGVNFQPATAQRLIGAGGLTGHPEPLARALIHFNRLPERHNDMIFAVIVARFGLVGGLATVGLVGVWVAGSLLTGMASRDPFPRVVAVALGLFVAVQAAVNVGMNVGVLPIIGVTLPFVSYGGTSLMAAWMMTGIVACIGIHRDQRRLRTTADYDRVHGQDAREAVPLENPLALASGSRSVGSSRGRGGR